MSAAKETLDGASGLIGHKLFQKLSPKFETYGALQKNKGSYNSPLFNRKQIIDNFDADNFDNLTRKLNDYTGI